MSDEATPRCEILHLARVTLEALTPISLGAGEASHLSDVLVFRDANGLPAIPGASLQGVLRHLWREVYRANPDALFGWARDDGTGMTGRLVIGFGAPHDGAGNAMTGLVARDLIEADPVLKFLAAHTPVRRDHVKLNQRHVADDRAKFDRAAVPCGTRFSFEIAMWGEVAQAAEDKAQLAKALALLRHPAFRLGGAGRRGYGRTRLVAASYARPDLGDADTLRRMRRKPPSALLPETLELTGPPPSGTVIAQLRLRPLGPWRIGGSGPALTNDTPGIRGANGRFEVGTEQSRPDHRTVPEEEDHTIRILNEPSILWRETVRGVEGSVQQAQENPADRFVLPGSAVRGPLAHRALFHWNKTQGHFIDAASWRDADPSRREAMQAEWDNRGSTRPAELVELLGVAKERQSGAGQASRLFVADGIAESVVAVQALTHNVIDRFTGGVINQLLYAEEVVLGGEITVDLAILPPHSRGSWDERVIDALLGTLQDLVEGRLALGAKSHGFCTGSVTWSGDAGQWERKWRALSSGPNQAASGGA